MELGGNGPFNALYMHFYIPGVDIPIPNVNDINSMKEFINLKYNKKWYGDGILIPAAPSNPFQNISSGGGGGMNSKYREQQGSITVTKSICVSITINITINITYHKWFLTN